MNRIKVSGISKGFDTVNGRRQILKNVSFEIPENCFTVIGGANGSGKTLLMNIISGLEEADSGTIETYGKPGLVFQEAETQILGETPREDIAFGPKNLKWPKEKILKAVEDSLEKTGLKEKADFPARFLSGGEKRRLAIACMLSMDLSIIILDEPYANLDYTGVKQVNQLLKSLKEQKKTIILLTHEIEKCLGLAERFIVLHKGEIKFDGTPSEALNQNMEEWEIKNPLNSYKDIQDLVW